MRSLQLLIFAGLISTNAFAQVRGHKGNIGATAGVGVATGEFADTWGQDMFTFGGHVAAPFGRLPLQAGFAFDYGIMGRTKAIVPVSDAALTATEGDLLVNAKVLSYHGLLRFSPLKGKVQPYVEGLAGLRQFTTKTTISVEGLDRPISKERNANDYVLSAGWAAGLMVNLGGTAYIEARVERFKSGQATYVDPGSIAVDAEGNVDFNTLESGTHSVNALLGLGIRF